MLVMIMFISILCINLVSASDWFGYDNYKKFEKTGEQRYGTIKVYDKDTFSEDDLLSSTTLEYNTDACLINCEARGTTTFYEDSDLIDELKIYLAEDTSKLTNIQEKVVWIKTGEEDVEVDDYKEICKDIDGKQECQKIRDGKVLQRRNIYEVYDGNKVKAGTYEWKITGKKSSSQSVDWIVDVNGITLNEWASWNSTYNTNLEDYFNMSSNENSRNKSRNMSVLNGQIEFNVTAINGLSGKFSNTATMNVTQSTEATIWSFSPTGTLNFWIYIQVDGATEVLFDKRASGNNFLLTKNAAEQLANSNGGLVSSSLSIGSWHMGTYVINSSGQFFYTDGVLDGSYETAYGGTGAVSLEIGDGSRTAQLNFKGNLDEIGYWNRQLSAIEINDLYNGGTGIFYEDTTPTAISTTLHSPPNYFNTSSTSVAFNCSATATSSTIVNISLEIDGVKKTTTTGTGTYLQINSTQVSTEGSHNWTCRASNNNSNEDVADQRKFTIDLTAPSINITAPNGTGGVGSPAKNMTVTWQLGELTPQACLMQYGGVNYTLRCTDYNSSFIYGTDKFLIIFANDTFGNQASSLSNFDFSITVNNVTYNPTALTTSTQSFVLNLSITNPSSVSGKLVYNNTEYSSTVLSGDNYIFTNNISIPSVTLQTNKSFYWSITLGGSQIVNTSLYNQTINPISFSICNSDNNVSLIKFDSKSAENPFATINATLKSAWKISTTQGGSYSSYSHEDITETNSSWEFCTNDASNTFYVDSDIEYDATGYSLNNYFLDDATLTNISQNITLYLLNDSKATLTILKVVDKSQLPQENVTIQIQLYDVGTDTFYTIAMAKTAFNGEDIAYLNWYDSLYKMIFTKDGIVVKSVNPYRITETPQIFTLDEASTFVYDKFLKMSYDLYYNNITGNFVLTFTKPSGEVEKGCLRVLKRGATDDQQICDVCETSSSATVYCNIGTYGNGTYIASFYATGSYWIFGSIIQTIGGNFAETIYDLLGNDDATFYALMFSGVCVTLMFVSLPLGILGILLGMLGGAALGFQVVSWGAFLSIVIIGGAIIWFVKK